MKYLLKQNKEDKGILCDKVTIDGYSYYVSEEEIKVGDWYTWDGNKNNAPSLCTDTYNESSILDSQGFTKFYKVIAATNPNIDIPKVVDEIEKLAFDYYEEVKKEYYSNGQKAQLPKSNKEFQAMGDGFIAGYNKSQETHPFSEDDMIEFAEWCQKPSLEDLRQPNVVYIPSGNFYWHKHKKYTPKELLQLWKEQQSKIVYYE